MPDWTVAIAILFFLWVLSAVAQPQGQLKSQGVEKSEVEESRRLSLNSSTLHSSTSALGRLSAKRREHIRQKLLPYGQTPVDGMDEIGYFKWL